MISVVLITTTCFSKKHATAFSTITGIRDCERAWIKFTAFVHPVKIYLSKSHALERMSRKLGEVGNETNVRWIMVWHIFREVCVKSISNVLS